MRFPRGSRAAVVAALVGLALPAGALAHVELVSPAPRSPGAKKFGPCGGDPAGRRVTVRAGARLVVAWKETIDHPGEHLLRLSEGPGRRFVTLARVKDLPIPAGASERAYRATVRLPRRAARAATLQLIQVMTDRTPPTLYFSCADLRILPPAA